MIRRRNDGGFLLIPQAQHARLAGDIVRRLGGALTVSPKAEELARAVKIHATGFDAFDAKPPLNAVGRAMNHDEIPLPTQLAGWRRSAELAAGVGAYHGMLVGLLALQRSAAVAGGARSMRENFDINKHQQSLMEMLAGYRPGLGLRNDVPLRNGLPEAGIELTAEERAFIHDYRLMLLSLQLGLEICSFRRRFGQLAQLPASAAPDAPLVHINFRNPDPGHTELSPFALAETVTLEFSGRVMEDKVYDHDLELLEDMEKAPVKTLQVELRPGESNVDGNA